MPPIAHLFLDATYAKARLNGVIADCAVFVAVGIETETGRRIVPGVSVGLSEAAEHWATFIQSLIKRGMNRPLTVTSDDHMGIRAALARTLTGALWQRCQFHFQRNAQAYVTTARYKSIAAVCIRSIFNAGRRKLADIMIANVLKLSARTGKTNSPIGLKTTSRTGKACISPENLRQTAEMMKAASSQPKKSAA